MARHVPITPHTLSSQPVKLQIARQVAARLVLVGTPQRTNGGTPKRERRSLVKTDKCKRKAKSQRRECLSNYIKNNMLSQGRGVYFVFLGKCCLFFHFFQPTNKPFSSSLQRGLPVMVSETNFSPSLTTNGLHLAATKQTEELSVSMWKWLTLWILSFVCFNVCKSKRIGIQSDWNEATLIIPVGQLGCHAIDTPVEEEVVAFPGIQKILGFFPTPQLGCRALVYDMSNMNDWLQVHILHILGVG